MYLKSGFGKFKEHFWSINGRGCTTSIWCCIYLLSSWTSCSISVLSGFKVIIHLTISLHSSGVRQLGSAVLLVTLVRCGWLVTLVKLPPIKIMFLFQSQKMDDFIIKIRHLMWFWIKGLTSQLGQIWKFKFGWSILPDWMTLWINIFL